MVFDIPRGLGCSKGGILGKEGVSRPLRWEVQAGGCERAVAAAVAAVEAAQDETDALQDAGLDSAALGGLLSPQGRDWPPGCSASGASQESNNTLHSRTTHLLPCFVFVSICYER